MKVIETREVDHGMRRRRYDAGTHRFTTFEVPAAVLKAFGMKRVREQLAVWQRGEERRADARVRRKLIEKRLAEGVKPDAIGAEVGVCGERVRQIRKELRRAAS